MARKPRPLGRMTLASTIVELALRHKAGITGVPDYTVADLARDSGLNHSVIWRAVNFDIRSEEAKHQPTLQTVQKLARTLGIQVDPLLENNFYNAFGYASPHQVASVEAYVSQKEKNYL